MKELVKVSVLITTYNAENFLDECLNSLVNQTYSNLQVVVVDDGSTDNSVEIMKNYQNQYSFIQPYFMSKVGRAKALNFGLNRCNGLYIAINDADDFSKPYRIQLQVDFLEENQQVGLLGGGMEIIEEERIYTHFPVRNSADIKRAFVEGQPIQHSTVMIRKKLLDKIGGYNERIPFLLDRDLFLRLARISELHQLDEVLITLNRSPHQYFRNKFTGTRRNWLSMRYQLKAVKYFQFSPLLKLRVIAKFCWSLILELFHGLKKRKQA